MRKISSFLLLIGLLLLNISVLKSQNVSVAGSTGANGTYATLKAAFDAINLQAAQAGNNIIITITGNTTESASAVLNQPATSIWNSLKIYPTAANLSITGNLAGSPLIDLNGADKVSIDGRQGATGITPSLTISNTSTSPLTNTSTIRFIESAENNIVKYCKIRGSTTVTTPNTGGIIYFSNASTGSGNINDTISFCNISSVNNTARATNAIYSSSNSNPNSTITISNNNIFNFFNPTFSSNGIYLQTNSFAWNISGNSFYDTTSFTPSLSSPAYYAINIGNQSNGDNFNILNNYIGGNAPSCTGTMTKAAGTVSNLFYAMYLNLSSLTTSNVQGNIIKNISWNNAGNANWYGIWVQSGKVNIGTINRNFIGDVSGIGSISVTNNTSSASVYGIYFRGAGSISNNAIGSITSNNTDLTQSTSIYGIYLFSLNALSVVTVNNNLIGSLSTLNSINASSTATGNIQTITGIYNAGNSILNILNDTIANITNGATGILNHQNVGIRSIATNTIFNISNNIIRNLKISNSNTSIDDQASIVGISLNANNGGQNISSNTLYNFSNANLAATGQSFIGLFINSLNTNSITDTISRNFIHSFSTASSSVFYGIKLLAGANLLTNNIINLGDNSASSIYGVYENGAAANNNTLYFNTIYIGGSPTTGNAGSYALYSNTSNNTRIFENNIFNNARSNSGATGTHYSAFFNYGVSTNLTLDYNDYFTSGTGGILARYGGSDISTLANLKTLIGQDLNSLNKNPVFTNPGGTNPGDYVPNTVVTGLNISGLTTDYFFTNRAFPTMGAIETSNIDVYSNNIYQATYPTLKATFDAINAGTHQGSLTAKIKGSTNETATATLNASGSGAASYTSLNIYPITSGISIRGSIAGPMIDLNGADRVSFDGRLNASGSTKDLIISNTDISASANNATIMFRESAEFNMVKYCHVKGSTSSASSGIILFSSSASGNGNDTDSITYCNISSDTTGRSVNAIYSLGANGFDNSSIVISNNNIFNFINPALTSAAILTASYNAAWTIRDNSIYDTATISPTANAAYYGIRINSPVSTGTNFLITNNYIGGNSPLCNGWLTKTASASNPFTGIEAAVGTNIASSIQSNYIKKINWSNNATAVSNWTGINVASGQVLVGTVSGNIIGSSTGNDSIIVSNGTYASSQPWLIGISNQSNNVVTLQNNMIGALRSTNSDNTSPTGICGIISTNNGNITINSNTIGSSVTANSINAASPSSSNQQDVYGINCQTTGTISISSNIIANLTNAVINPTALTAGRIKGIALTDAGAAIVTSNFVRDLKSASPSTIAANDTNAAVIGIQHVNSTAGSGSKVIINNFIYNLSNTNGSGIGSNIIGLLNDPSNTVLASYGANFIHSFSGNPSTVFYGIKNNKGNSKLYNNIINLTTDTANTIYGLWENSAANSSNDTIYFNTIYVGGSISSTSNSSYALYSNSAAAFNRNIRNNIFVNARSNGSSATGKHYAAYFNYGVNTNLTLNYNNYYVSGTGGYLGYYAGSDFNSLPIVAANDANSQSINPIFVNAGGNLANNYIINASLSGLNGLGITTDYFAVTRSIPSMGAIESSIIDVYSNTVYQASYSTLKAAFDAINAGTHTSTILVKIKGNTTETLTAGLNASGSGSASYTSVTINPVGGRTVTGAIAAGSPLINLNGADKVKIDGLNNGTDSLILKNTTIAGTAGTSTIRFIGDARFDTVTNCYILGASNAAAGTAAGTILFSTGTTTGNDNNTISNNYIGNITGSNPSFAITSTGSAGSSNDTIAITGNKIFNWFATTGANAVNITSNSSTWNISNNKFYQTASLSGLASGNYLKCIAINGGNGYNINNNTMGYANAYDSGMFTISGGRFTGIDILPNSAVLTNIQGNTINNINWTTLSGANTPGSGVINGIIVNGGAVNIGSVSGNTIGSLNGVGSSTNGIYLTSSTTGSAIIPVYVSSTTACNISNNKIGAIATGGAAGIGYYFYGIYVDGSGSHTVNQNNIGGSLYNSIAIGTTGTTTQACFLYGITSSCSGSAITIGNTAGSGNTIHNMNNNSSGAGLIYAISNNGAISNLIKINYNTIDSLFFSAPTTSSSNCYLIYNTAAAITDSLYITNNAFGSKAASYTGAGSGNFYGIYQSGTPFKSIISNNTIDSLTLNTTGTIGLIWNSYPAPANGIKTIQNNTVTGINRSLATITSSFYGYYDIASSPATASVTISGNNFTNITANTTGANGFYGIYHVTPNNLSLNVYNNSLTNISFNGTSAINLLYLNGFGGTALIPNKVYGNKISGFSSNSNTPNFYGIYIGANNNYIDIYNDTVQNFNLSGTSGFYGIYHAGNTNTANYYNNVVRNITNTTAGNITAFNLQAGNTINIYQNAFNSLSSIGNVSGINVITGSNIRIYQHKPTITDNYSIYGLSSSGATSVVNGISIASGSNVKIYKNNIYTLSNSSSGTTTLVNGINLAGGTNDTVFNNTIGDLTAPAANYLDAIRGIAITSSTVFTNFNLFYNTINLAASSTGTTFGTSGIYHNASAVATTAALNLRNNIIINNSTSSGSGINAAYRRSGTSLSNYANPSNNNLFYAGSTLVASKLIMYDGTNSYQTLAAYKAIVGLSPRDSASITLAAAPVWLSSTGSNINYLHIDPNSSLASTIDNKAVNIATFTDDIDNDIRQGNPGYIGIGSRPDIGADEFDIGCTGTPSASSIVKAFPVICTGSTDSLWLSTIYSQPGISYQWTAAAAYTGPFTNKDTLVYQLTGALATKTYYKCTISCINSGLSFVTPIDSVMVSPLSVGGTATASLNTVCSGTGTSITLSGNTGSIQWQSSTDSIVWTNIIGQTSSTLATGNLAVKTYYRAIVTSGACTSATSSVAIVLVDPLTIAGSVTGGISVCAPTNSTLLTLSGNLGNVVKWQSSTNGGSNWTDIANTLTTYTANNLSQTTQYRAIVQNGVCNSDSSTATTITVIPASVGGLISGSTIVCPGTNSSLLTLSGNTGNVIKWQSSIDGGTSWNDIADTLTTYTAINVNITTIYRAVVQSGNCTSANSATATITLSVLPAATITASTNPTICGGTNGTATVNAAVSYSWNTSPIQTTQIASGLSAGTYVVTISDGVCTNSTSVVINDPTAPAVTIIANDTTICTGTSVTFTAAGVGATLFEFYINNAIVQGYSASPTYTTSTLVNNDIVTVKGKTAGGCTGSSTPITMLVSAATIGGTLTGTTTVCSNANSTLLTLNGYTGNILRWELSTTGGATWTSIVNTNNTYTATNLNTTTIYRAVVQSGYCNPVNSTIATITVTTIPTATISYTGSPFCSNLPPVSVVQTGNAGGSYTAAPAGLSINAGSGLITPGTSTGGTYTVSYTIAASGGCPAVVADTIVTISTIAVATFSYAANPYCKNAVNPSPTFSGGGIAGVFSSTAGLNFVSTSTGQVDLAISNAGTYTVTNTIAAAAGCPNSTATSTITITTLPVASISYTGSPFCQTVTGAQGATFSGTTGGTYSAAPAGLTLNTSTGAITPNTSSAATYTVTYTIAAAGGCAAVTATAILPITPAPTASIAYSGSPYCSSLTTTQTVTFAGTAGGKYRATPILGLTLDSLSGGIVPSTSTAGTYTVTYTIAASGGCSTVTTSTTVTITTSPIASYTYSSNSYCSNAPNPSPSYIGGGSAGIFSATPAGLNFVSTATGQVNLATSTGNTYIITNTKSASGGCPAVTAADTITITTLPSATISYTGSPFCRSVTTAQAVTRTGTAGGTYSASPGGLTLAAATGAITPSTSFSGTYTVTYTMAAAGGCSTVTTTTSVTITAAPSATINYNGSPYCTSDTNFRNVTRIGTAGGTYSAPAGLSLNTTTGAIKPSTSTPGTYTVTYTIAAAGGCAAFTASKAVTITLFPTASITYTGSPFCTSVTTPQSVTLTGTTGGVYSFTPGTLSLTLSTTTGAIIPSTSTGGNYTVTYTIAAAGGCVAVSDTANVTITEQPILKDSSNAPICEQDNLLLYSTFINGASYQWNGPNGFSSSLQNPIVATYATASLSGTYNLIVTGIPGGCPDMNASIAIVVNPKPVASFINTPKYPEVGEDITLEYTGTTATLWNWIIDGALVSNVEKPIINIDHYGITYIYLYVENTFGCKDTITNGIYIKELSKVWTPNAFTPDGDGVNDIYMVHPVSPVKKFSMRIFNRFGQMVFETQNIDQGWDGTYKGEECPIGTYIVVLNYTQIQVEQSFEVNQSVTLIR